ncbi:MAG: sigma-54 dependent transcriptional regulator [Planctomycetales bacterium]
MSRLLIVDDEPAICWSFKEFLSDEGHQVATASSAEEALKLAGTRKFDAVVLDVRLPGIDGISAIAQLRKKIDDAPIIVITAFGDLETAVRAIAEGAFDYLTKPFDLDQAMAVIRRALAAGKPQQESSEPPSGHVPAGTLVGTSPRMQHVFKQIALVAPSEIPVLITGESGTGKELVARAIHRHSPRKDGAYFPVSLAALNPNLVESELFGHVKGAFTGAAEDRRGIFELAEGGTILLDEIGDISIPLQIKLLRAIEHHEITPVGDVRARPINIRLLAATNRSLEDLMAKGEFREDLYYRLSGFHIHLPPLRERVEDISVLVSHFLQNQGDSENAIRLSDAALQFLTRRYWSGNVRELRNALEHASLIARRGELLPEHFPDEILPEHSDNGSALPGVERHLRNWVKQISEIHAREPSEEIYERFLNVAEPPLLRAVLQECEGNRALAAQRLGIHRATLRQKLRKYGID